MTFLDTPSGGVYTTASMPRTDQTVTESTEGRRRALLWWGLATLSLAGGYADLIRGGETIAPILLVVGYCILVPVAILNS
jgi:hypothetical protein